MFCSALVNALLLLYLGCEKEVVVGQEERLSFLRGAEHRRGKLTAFRGGTFVFISQVLALATLRIKGIFF